MAEPILDIVMLLHSQAAWADLAIRAVEHHTKNPYRLILVDQAATDPKVKEVMDAAAKRGHLVLHMAENRSFSNGCNAGIRVGSAKFVCLLNDDALVTEGWDSGMIQDCSDRSVGLVGARTNYASGPTGDPGWVGEPPYMVFVCVMFRRDTYEKIGPLDEETFTGFSCEDLDYCWRVRKGGYKLKVSNAGYVLHAGSRSIVAMAAAGTKDPAAVAQRVNAYNEKYNRALLEKWGKEWVADNTKLRQKVLVVSYHAEEWTRVRFAGSLITLKAGTASGIAGGAGADGQNYGFTYYQHVRTPIHLARQIVCDYATDQGFDYLVQLDDDATFPPDLIRRLMAHQKDVVTALAYQRKTPYLPCIFEFLEDGQMDGRTGKIAGQPLENYEHTGLRKVDVSGFHVSLMKLSVIKKMRAFRSEKYPEGIREYWGGFTKAGEDFCFSAHLKEIGVPLYCDTELIAGHIGSAVEVNEEYKQLHRAGKAP